ncbi:uncharacterized protein L203_104231 [Cryptococcus depauperatus CBS 7841]|uniref:Uncharacterized protein n=1 Tax=Cryptococcus depauperatus CBS 7841 TaxID=1295531 RepID=A0A1E3I573_9TREE|nr:hypothetical protein L203_05234 [Cryptococcus depauperatus CBS 7841]
MWSYPLTNYPSSSTYSQPSPESPEHGQLRPPITQSPRQQRRQGQIAYGSDMGLPNNYPYTYSPILTNQPQMGVHPPSSDMNSYNVEDRTRPLSNRGLSDGEKQVGQQERQQGVKNMEDFVTPRHSDSWNFYQYQSEQGGSNLPNVRQLDSRRPNDPNTRIMSLPWTGNNGSNNVYEASNYSFPSYFQDAPTSSDVKDYDLGTERSRKRSRMDDSSGENVKLEETSSTLNVASKVAQLHTHLTELIQLIKPFASQPGQSEPEQPSPYLTTRFARLSTIIHTILFTLAPHIHSQLAPEFKFTYPNSPSALSKQNFVKRSPPPIPTKSLVEMTSAEKEMEIIRKRRDALIAKAQAANANVKVIGQKDRSHGPAPTNADTVSSNWAQVPLSSRETYNSLDLGNFTAVTEASKPTYAYQPSAAPTQRHQDPVQRLNEQQDPNMLSPRSMTWLGRCHGCGSSVTTTWRRGPDGPDSLCDSCGMHYERLLKKKDSLSPNQNNGTNGQATSSIGSSLLL